MKKWIKTLLVTGIIVGTSLEIGHHFRWEYKFSPYVENVIEKNMKASNYEREMSISVSFDKEKNKDISPQILDKVDDSILIIHEAKNKEGQFLEYRFTSQGEDFEGSRVFKDNLSIVKSPMYHRYVCFTENRKETDKNRLNPIIHSFIEKNHPSFQIYRDISANEEGVTTLVLKGKNEEVKETLMNMVQAVPYSSLFYQNALIKNKLLKEHQSEEQVEKETKQKMISFQQKVLDILRHSQVKDSVVSLKFTKEQVMKEVSADIKLEYISHTKKTITYSLYFTLNTWNVGKAKIKEFSVNSNNSILYSQMTDDMNYFQNENLQQEVHSEEDGKHAHKGFKENTSTLKAIGDFVPVIPKEQ